MSLSKPQRRHGMGKGQIKAAYREGIAGAYWSPELCFVEVPIKGAERYSLHLIEEDLAMRFLPSGKILRFRLASATKPNDLFFLCRIPTRNLDHPWNRDSIAGCEQAKTRWTQATSRGEEGIDA